VCGLYQRSREVEGKSSAVGRGGIESRGNDNYGACPQIREMKREEGESERGRKRGIKGWRIVGRDI
jgi:hypothetical protein